MGWRLFCLFFLLLQIYFQGSSSAQSREKPNLTFGKIQDLDLELTTVPDSVGSGGRAAPAGMDAKTSPEGRWLRIDVPFSTEKPFTPEIKFKFYLEGYEGADSEAGPGKPEKKFVVLTGEAQYRDVPKGGKHFAGVFLPPASVLRFSGVLPNGENNWVNRQLNLRVEAVEGGIPVAEVFDLQLVNEKAVSGRGGKKDPEWFKSPDAQEISGVLLPITETPFWPKDYKRYPQPKNP